MNNSLWQRRQSIAKFPSQTLRKPSTQQQTKLPLLNIGHFLKVELRSGQSKALNQTQQ